MTLSTQDWDTIEAEVAALLADLIPTIGDEYRAAEEDDVPGMCVTVGMNDTGAWGYQTGDNSYTGGAYGFPYWGIGYLYRDSDPAAVARGIVDEIADLMES